MAVWTKTGAGTQNKTQDFGETILGFSYTNVFGMKMTNVFGLAWNYYLLYTKFITGLDLTLDLGWKIEMFYASTYKIGYADTTDFGVVKSTDLTKYRAAFYATKETLVENSAAVIATETNVVENRVENVAVIDSEIGVQAIAAGAITETVEGAKIVTADSIVESVETKVATAAVSFIINSALISFNDGTLEVI